MQNQLHAIDPSLRSTTISSSPNAKQQHQYQEPPHPHQHLQPQAQTQSRSQGPTHQGAYSPLETSPNNSYQGINTPNYYGHSQGVQDSPEEHSPNNPAASNDANDLKRPRACEACRQLKVKCEIDDNSPNGSCKRCAKAHRQCVITLPSRKRQKKTDSRVAELEKKIDALTASLAARGGADPDGDTDLALDPAIAQQHYQPRSSISAYPDQWPGPRSPSNPPQIAGMKRKTMESYGHFGGELQKPHNQNSMMANGSGAGAGPGMLPATDTKYSQAGSESPARDIVERGLIDAKAAYKCFERYHNEMCQRLPVIVFPQGTTAEEIRKTKPTLFHAIVAVASGTIRPDLQSKIISDATKILAERIVSSGEKSMELVQTIQVLTIFYQPPERYEELNFNQLTHMAAVMAMDIGMGKRTKKGAPLMFKGFMDRSKVLPDPDAAETRRSWLGCYYMCSNSAMSLRRPLLIRWSPYADECIGILQSAPDTLPSDKFLCQIVKAQHIAEMIGNEFAMDDPAKEVRLTDSTVQRQLKGLEQDLERWQKQGDEFMSSPVMRHTKAIINLYMHEIAMHNEHNIDDFRPPYHSTPIEGPPDPESLTPVHIDSLTKCLHSAHEAFDAFLSMDINFLRSLPTHFFVRNSYAAVALIKLYTAIAARESKMSSLFKPADLKVEYYLDGLIAALMKVAESGMSRVAYKFSIIFQMLRHWHVKRTEVPSGRASREHSQPHMPSKAIVSTKMPTYNTAMGMSSEAHQNTQAQPQIWQTPNPHSSAARTGLQMLSEAAMNSNPRMQQEPQYPGQNPAWLSPPPPDQQGQHPHQGQSTAIQTNAQLQPAQPMHGDPHGGIPMVIDPMMAAQYGMPPDQMALMDFTGAELMAYGFGDEFLAMNFGFDQGGGWAI